MTDKAETDVTMLAARRRFAEALVAEAGRLALRMRETLAPVEAKSAIDFCTEADRAVERLIREAIARQYGDAILGEEYGGTADAGDGGLWVVDPIDGTTEYIHGSPRWCVSLAYMQAGEIQLGMIYEPVAERLFSAQSGAGASLNGKSIAVSHLAHAAVPVVEVGWSDRRPLDSYSDLLHMLVASRMEFRRRGSGALGLADVACGINDAYVELHINAWDALAGILLVHEAGGWTNDFLADDGLTRGNLIMASTPELQARLSALVPGNGRLSAF
jgi:myo-inositol-1(or 4)-monophosphatase